MRNVLGLALLMMATALTCLAGAPPAAPEIDPASGSAALALLAGALLVLRARRAKKN